MKHLLFILLLVSLCFARTNRRSRNINGWVADTVSITDTLDSGVVYYTDLLSLTDFENLKVLLHVDDSTSAGLTADSINLRWGFYTACYTFDSLINTSRYSEAKDTLKQKIDMFVIDTMRVDSFGLGTMGSISSDGTFTRSWNMSADTSSVAGYAIQGRQFSPEWDEEIGFWVESLGTEGTALGNKTGAALEIRFNLKHRQYVPMGNN